MKFHFENLSLAIIAFYLVVSILLCGAWTFILKSILNYIFKEKLKFFNKKTKGSHIFITLTLILFVIFMILTLTDEPYEFNR